jgi:hypothetical protein
MDVYLKNALAVISAKNGLTSIEEITEEMIDLEIDFSMNKLFLYTTDNSKIVDKGVFIFAPKSELPNLLQNYDKIKGNIKIPPHLLISNLNKKSFLTIVVSKFDSLWKDNLSESNFVLFNSQSYLSKNGTNGYKIPIFERKLYFLSQITPYKASFTNMKGEKCGIFVDIEFPLLVKYMEIFIEHWNSFNQDSYIANVNKETKTFFNPQSINFDIKRRFNNTESPLIKFQILPFLTKIRTKAYLYDEIELYDKLTHAILYEINVDKKNAQQFNLNKYLIDFAIDDKITDFVKVMVDSFYRTYKEINKGVYEKRFSEMVYVLLNTFKSPSHKDNIKHINQLRLTYTNYNVNYENFIEIMETILKINNPTELITIVKKIAHSIKTGVWSHTHNWATENNKNLPKEKREHYDMTIRDMQFNISAMTSLTSFLSLSTNIKRRIGWSVDTEGLFDILIKNPNILTDLKDLLNFFLSQPYKKVIEEAPLEDEVETDIGGLK